MAEALHVTLRKKVSHMTHRMFAKIFPVDLTPDSMDIESIDKILVVRINYRIGNILFTTPLLNALEKRFPHAQIDMIVGAPFTTSLIEGMPQIRKVYSFPRKLLKQPLKVLKFKKELKNNHYDLLIAPSLFSSSDSFFTFLVSARYKVGFYAPDVFSPLTHAVAFPKDVKHTALIPLRLMKAFDKDKSLEYTSYLDLRMNDKEKALVENDIVKHSIGIFRDARNEKKIENEWWSKLIDALHHLDTSLHFIDILDPNNTVPLNNTMTTLSEKDLRVLAAKISYLDAFICGDTGPMHLASASGTPTIALFKTTSPSRYGTLGKKDISLVMKDKSVEMIAKEIAGHLKMINTL